MTPVAPLIDDLFRREYGKMVAVLTRAFGLPRIGVAEDLVQETLLAAMQAWGYGGVPENPAAWLMTVAKNKARNHVKGEGRRRQIRDGMQVESAVAPPEVFFDGDVEDSVLRMMFACCHPEIAPADQLALILRTLCGFGAREAARALLVTEATLEKRFYRARRRVKGEGIALEVPGGADLEGRLARVCQSLYLLFNEGYSTTADGDPIRRDLCAEAMRLCGLLVERFPDQPPVFALMALFCLHVARFDSRVDDQNISILLADQDRSRWDRRLIDRGLWYLTEAARGGLISTYHLEATIAAQHCLADSLEATNWVFIQRMYRALLRLRPSPVVELNLAIVSARVDGPRVALAQLETLAPRLPRYPLLHATLAVIHAELGQIEQARSALRQAISVTPSEHQRSLLRARLSRL